MNAKYIVRTTLDRAACRALARHQTRRLKFYFFYIDVFLAVCAALLWRRGSSFSGLVLVLFALLLAYTFFLDRFAALLMFQAANHDVGETEYAFADEGITAVNRAESSRLPYAGFLGVHETGSHYFLYIQKRVAIILPKADFAAGDPADFGTYFSARSGRPLLRSRF